MCTILCRELREIEIQDLACRRHTSQETDMAKAKKRVARRKKSSKRGKASAQEGRKAHHAETGKVQGQGCRETHGQETAAIEDRGKEGTKKIANTSGGGAVRGNDHRRDRGAGPWRGCCY